MEQRTELTEFELDLIIIEKEDDEFLDFKTEFLQDASMYGKSIKESLSFDELQLQHETTPPSFVEVTPYIRFFQKNAALSLGMNTSTLSKRWKEATVGRKWPCRALKKLDRKIEFAQYNLNNQNSVSTSQQECIDLLVKERNELEQIVFIKI